MDANESRMSRMMMNLPLHHLFLVVAFLAVLVTFRLNHSLSSAMAFIALTVLLLLALAVKKYDARPSSKLKNQ
jgi:hypothetical protein